MTVTMLVALTVALVAHFMPQITRPDLFFGVSVQPAFRATAAAAGLLRIYRIVLWSTTLVCLAVAPALPVQLSPLVVLAQALGMGIAFALIHAQVRRYAKQPDTVVEIDLTLPQEKLPGGILIVLLPPAWLGALAIAGGLHIVRDGWACIVPAATAWGVLHYSRRIATSGTTAVNERRFRRFVVSGLLVLEYLLAVPDTLRFLLPEPRPAPPCQFGA